MSTAYELGWSTFKNGELIAAAQARGFEVLLTTDTNLKYQQNLTARSLAIVVISTTSRPRISIATDRIIAALTPIKPGTCSEAAVP